MLYAFRYADEFFVKTPKERLPPSSRFRKWYPTTAGEMKRFLGMVFAMGLVVQLSITEYWGMDDVTSTPFFGKCMARDRFLLIVSFWHLAPNNEMIARGEPGHDPLYKCGE